jgi:HK97 family phage prohead protease
MTFEIKHFAIEELKTNDDAFTFAGYASTFGNVDDVNDVVVPGAFARTIKERGPSGVVLLWQHDKNEPIGRPTVIREDSKGLYIESSISRTDTGMKAYTLLKDGVLRQMSIGYTAKKYSIDQKSGVRRLEDMDLWEVSLVTFPANEKAAVTAVKSRPSTIREFEDFLREAGFSQKDATTVALRGFKTLTTQGEPDEEVFRASQKLCELFNQFTA